MKVLEKWVSRFLTAAALLSATMPARAQDGPAAYQQSYDLEAESKIQDALSALERVPAAQQNYVFHLRRGWLRYLLGRHAEAITSYESACASAPGVIEPRLGLMLPQIALRRWIDVEKTATGVLRKEPLNYLANTRLAWALFNLGRWSDAAVVYARVVTEYPSDVEMRTGLAWSLLKQGKAAEAAAEFRRVLAVAPRNASAKEGLRASGVPSP